MNWRCVHRIDCSILWQSCGYTMKAAQCSNVLIHHDMCTHMHEHNSSHAQQHSSLLAFECDKEGLVSPLLGLWYQVARNHFAGTDRASMQGSDALYEIMASQRDRVFPQTFDFEKSTDADISHTEKGRELFGDMIERVDAMITAELAEAAVEQPSVAGAGR